MEVYGDISTQTLNYLRHIWRLSVVAFLNLLEAAYSFLYYYSPRPFSDRAELIVPLLLLQ